MAKLLYRLIGRPFSLYLLVLFVAATVPPQLTAELQSQDVLFDGMLLYRRFNESNEELIGLTPSTRYTFEIPTDACSIISADGIHIATKQHASVEIRNFLTSELIRAFKIQDTWRPCIARWADETTLRIPIAHEQTAYLDLNIRTGEISPYSQPDHTHLADPELPDRIDSQPFYPSPDDSFYLYERCLGDRRNTTSTGMIICTDEVDWGIYDTALKETTILDVTPGHVYAHPSPFNAVPYASSKGIAWSPDSRYLAIAERFIDTGLPLHILDMTTRQYANFDFYNVDIYVFDHDLLWSPDSQKLAFWIKGDINEIEASSPILSLIIFDTQSNLFTHSDITYEISSSLKAIWSPHGRAIAFIDVDANLILVNANTGLTTVLDTNVSNLEGWSDLSIPIDTTPD